MGLSENASGSRVERRDVHRARDAELLIRLTGASLAASFAAVGVVFLLIPDRVLTLFNEAGGMLGLPASPTHAFTLYLALAVAYMYVVTLLAVQMVRRPQVTAYPWVLVQAKAASALVCLVLFAAQDQYLIYLANAVVDGTIAVCVWAIAVRGAAPREVRAPSGDAVAGAPAPRLGGTAS